jgi:hypothetical protein
MAVIWWKDLSVPKIVVAQTADKLRSYLCTARFRKVDASPEISSNQQREALPVFLMQLAIVFLISYLALFLGMPRRPGMYDEGIMLTGAMRVAAGQIPHRDFYFIYGPAEAYILAGLFKVFGTSLLAERLFDLFFKALVVTAVYAIVSSYCRKSIAIFISFVALMWFFGLNGFGYAITPVSLLNLVGTVLILPVFTGRVSTRRMLAAGAISGTASLFRYDTGIALLGIHVCVIAIALYPQSKGAANRLRLFASAFWPYLLGFAVLTVPPALYYLSVAPVAALVYDIILFPRRYYFAGRNLPFPGMTLKEFENLGIYLPLAIAAISLYALLKRDAEPGSQGRRWRGFLLAFGLLLVVMYLKGLVRVSSGQLYLAIIPSLLLIAVLFQHRSAYARPVRILITCLMVLSFVPAAWSSLHEIRLEQLRFLSVAQKPHTDIETAWCKFANPLTRGVCFLPEDDRIHAVEFISSHTQPGQPLYSGLKHHDRVFANDNIIYFATERLPATHWSHFDPDLQNRLDIQTQMIRELERNPPPYVTLDAEFDLIREPNDSSKSSGVTLLDDYIHTKYEPRETFGTISIWQRR